MTGTRAEPDSEQIWRHMLVAKYTGIVHGSDPAIAHEVYVARVGRKHRTKLNSGVTVELGWLDHVSVGHAPPHHHSELSHMWRMLAQQGCAQGARAPTMRRTEAEVATAIGQRVHHVPKGTPRGSAKERAQAREIASERALAAVAALQSTGHLATAPAQSYDKDLALAVSEGWHTRTLALAELQADWTYHAGTAHAGTAPPAPPARPLDPQQNITRGGPANAHGDPPTCCRRRSGYPFRRSLPPRTARPP